MDALIVKGPAKLNGSVQISGSKNTALPLIFTSLLFDKEIHFNNVPRLWDIETALKILSIMGTESEWKKEEGLLTIFPKVTSKVAPYEWVKRMRASVLALGPLIARFGEAKVSLPGGCAIGARPVNYHIDALRLFGVDVKVEEGYIKAQVRSRLTGAHVIFPEVTVTGTENILIVASQAEGHTRIENAASEPEVIELGEFLKSCGAKIQGLGTQTIEIVGALLKSPKSQIRIPPDRIEAGTWISASMVTRSPLELLGADASVMKSTLDVFKSMGAKFSISEEKILVNPPSRFNSLDVTTEPYPGFPTDMQAQLLTTLCFAEGKSSVRETIFENRFMHVAELRRLGARIKVIKNQAIVEGPVQLTGAPVMATDLRASASLVVAALGSEGKTTISRIYHLDRGYQRLDSKLTALGVKVTRVSE